MHPYTAHLKSNSVFMERTNSNNSSILSLVDCSVRAVFRRSISFLRFYKQKHKQLSNNIVVITCIKEKEPSFSALISVATLQITSFDCYSIVENLGRGKPKPSLHQWTLCPFFVLTTAWSNRLFTSIRYLFIDVFFNVVQ